MAYNNVKVKARQTVTQSSTQTKDLGTVSEVPMGEWNINTPYKKLNKVRYVSTGGSGVTLLAKKANQGVEPFISNGWQEVWMVENYDGGAVIPNGTYPDMTVGNATNAQNDGTGTNIANQFAEVAQDIQGLRDDVTNESHFRGMFESVEALQAAYPTATPNDYAYIVGGNIYIWQNNAWQDSEEPSPNTAVPKGTSTPLMDGVGSAGVANEYAAIDHRHPSDTSKANTTGQYGNLKSGGFVMERAIDGVNFDGSAAITHYGVCVTPAETTAKIVSLTGFTLVKGARITVNFMTANTVSLPTLNVNETGAKPIKCKNYTSWLAWRSETMTLVYDGANWCIVDGYSLADKPVGTLIIDKKSPGSIYGGSWVIDGLLSGQTTTKSATSGGYISVTAKREQNLCSIEIPANSYAVISGYATASVADANAIMNAQFTTGDQDINCRTTLSNGGGICIEMILSTESAKTITLKTYNYRDTATPIGGTINAIIHRDSPSMVWRRTA